MQKWSRTPTLSKLTHMIISCRDLVGSHREVVQTDMIISCGDLRLVGSARHRKVSHSRGLGPAARWGGVPKVAPEPSPYIVLRAVWLVALVFQKVAPESPLWPVGVLVVAPMGWCSKSWGGVPKSCPRILDGVVFQKLGWCSKKLSQNPHSVYY